MSKSKAKQSSTIITPINSYDIRFSILFFLSSLLSLAFLICSFPAGCYCFDCSCNSTQIYTRATLAKFLMTFTVIPAALGLYISIRPLFLIKKTSFQRKTKTILMVIASLLLFNTVVTPVAIVTEWVTKYIAGRHELRMQKMENCLDELVEYNRHVISGYYDDEAHFETIRISGLQDDRLDQLLSENEDLSNKTFKHCAVIKDKNKVKLSEELEELAKYCRISAQPNHRWSNYECGKLKNSKERVDKSSPE